MANTIVGDNLVEERDAFTFPHKREEVVKETAFASCPNLVHILCLIEVYSGCDPLGS